MVAAFVSDAPKRATEIQQYVPMLCANCQLYHVLTILPSFELLLVLTFYSAVSSAESTSKTAKQSNGTVRSLRLNHQSMSQSKRMVLCFLVTISMHGESFVELFVYAACCGRIGHEGAFVGVIFPTKNGTRMERVTLEPRLRCTEASQHATQPVSCLAYYQRSWFAVQHQGSPLLRYLLRTLTSRNIDRETTAVQKDRETKRKQPPQVIDCVHQKLENLLQFCFLNCLM